MLPRSRRVVRWYGRRCGSKHGHQGRAGDEIGVGRLRASKMVIDGGMNAHMIADVDRRMVKDIICRGDEDMVKCRLDVSS